MIADDVITGRISAYSCCMGAAMYSRLQALRTGDVKGAGAILEKALLLQWAIRVLGGYTLSNGQCRGEMPSTDEDVQCAMDLADLCCPVPCGCCDEDAGAAADPCAIAMDHTANAAVIASARLEVEGTSPATGDSYLVTGGENDLWAAATIQTWDGTGWTATVLALGDVIDVAGTPWTYTAQGVDLLYPPYNMQLVDANGTYQFAPVDPAITVSLHRDVLIQTFNGTWLTVYSTTEDALYAGLSVAFGMLPFSAARVVYTWGAACRKPVDVAAIIPPQLECGVFRTLTVAIEDNPLQGDFKLKVTVDIGDFLMGNIEFTWPGGSDVQPGAEGVSHYGPWPVGTPVQVTMHNLNNPECDIDLGTFTGGQCFVPSPACTPVDASFMGSANPTTNYFIISDTTGAGNLWSNYVGFTVTGGAFTMVLPGSDVLLTPGSWVIWTGSEIMSLAPQIHATYTDDTLYYVSQEPVVHGLRSRHVLVEGHSVSNGWFTIYEGPEAALASQQSVPYNSVVSVVDMIRATYTWGGCSLSVEGDDIAPVSPMCNLHAVDVDMVLDAGDITGYLVYPNVDNINTPAYYGPATAYIKSDTGGVLSGNPSVFETVFGVAPSFGVGDIVEFKLTTGTFALVDQVVQVHLPAMVNNLLKYQEGAVVDPLGWTGGYPASNYSPAGLYKRNPDSSVTLYWQTYSVTQAQPDEITLTASAGAPTSPHSVKVEYMDSGGAWVNIGTFTDVALAAGMTLAVDVFATALRTSILYNDGQCAGPVVEHPLTPLILDLVIPFSEMAPWGDLTPQRRYLWRSYDRQAWTRTQWPIGGVAMSGAKELGETLTGSEPLLEYSMAASMHRDTRVAQGFFGSGASGLCFVDNNWVSLFTNDFSDLFITTNPSPPPSIIPLSPYVTALLPEAILSVSVFAGATGTDPAYCLAAGQNSSLYLASNTISAVPLTGLILSANEILSCAYMSAGNYLLFLRNNSWRTVDGGATWVEMPLKVGFSTIALDDNVALVVATASDDTRSGVFRTTDAGVTWAWIDTEVAYGGDVGGFCASSATAVCRGGMKSLDGGATWTAMNLPAEVTGSHRVLMLSAEIIILATDKVWYSTDGGATFSLYPVQPPADAQKYGDVFAALTGWKVNY